MHFGELFRGRFLLVGVHVHGRSEEGGRCGAEGDTDDVLETREADGVDDFTVEKGDEEGL